MFPWRLRMETTHELHGASFTARGWFLLSFYVLHCYGVEAVPGMNVGDQGERGGQGSLFDSKAEGEESLFLDWFKLMWPVDSGLCAVMSRKHNGAPFLAEGKVWHSLGDLPFI